MNPDAIFVLIPITALMIPIVAIISRTVTKMIALKESSCKCRPA